MKKKIKAVISLLLAALLLALPTAGAFADAPAGADETGPTRYTNISDYNCSCYVSGITLHASAYLAANSSMSLQITIELQKLTDGAYSTIKTWTDSKTGLSLSMDESKTINVFSTYRIKATFNAGGETATAYDYA